MQLCGDVKESINEAPVDVLVEVVNLEGIQSTEKQKKQKKKQQRMIWAALPPWKKRPTFAQDGKEAIAWHLKDETMNRWKRTNGGI